MKKIFLFAVIASLLFAVSCDKKELAPEKKLTKIEQLQKMADENGGILSEVTDKNANILDEVNFDGKLYYYYPDADNLQNRQNIILTEDNPTTLDFGVFPHVKTGTKGNLGGAIICTGISSNCTVVMWGNTTWIFM